MKSVTGTELRFWMQTGSVFYLVDVREDWEREIYNIGGHHLPLSEFNERKEEIPKTGPVVIYCEKGIRSQLVIQRLEEAGYTDLYNLDGGMKAWKRSDPTLL